MNNTPALVALRTDTRKLLALLDDPHPGLFTWHEMVWRQVQRVGDYAASTQDTTGGHYKEESTHFPA